MESSSILEDIKKLLGLPKEYTIFDLDITVHINSMFSKLYQLGVDPLSVGKPFAIEDPTTKWSDFLGSETSTIESIKTYIYLGVRLVFDPPQNSFVVTSLKEQMQELEWRIHFESEVTKNEVTESEVTNA